MSTRTTVILDERSRRAARALAKRLDVTPSEVMRRALVHFHDHVLAPPKDRRLRRKAALARLYELFDGHDATAEVRRLKAEDPYF